LVPLHRYASCLGISHKSTQHLEDRRLDTFDVGGLRGSPGIVLPGRPV